MYSLLTEGESKRNSRGDDRLYVRNSHKGFHLLNSIYSDQVIKDDEETTNLEGGASPKKNEEQQQEKNNTPILTEYCVSKPNDPTCVNNSLTGTLVWLKDNLKNKRGNSSTQQHREYIINIINKAVEL